MLRRLILAAALAFLPCLASAQSVPLQGGPWAPGHAPMYTGGGFSQPVIQDGGSAAGGSVGQNISEIGMMARSPSNTYPAQNAGNGPFFSNFCDYDAPTTNAGGYHYICLNPNYNGSALISVGSGGSASPSSLFFNINGVVYPFSSVVGSASYPTVANNAALMALQSFMGTGVWRVSFSSPGDAPPVFYNRSSAPCSLNTGSGDLGLQVPALGGGCWIAALTFPADVRIWGAKGDGSDSTAALQAAFNSGVKWFTVPPGVFSYSTLSIPNAVTVDGVSRGTSILSTSSPTADAITLYDNVLLRNLGLDASVPRTAGCTVLTRNNSTTVELNSFTHYFKAYCATGSDSSHLTINPVLQDNIAFFPSVGAGSVFAFYDNFGGAVFRNNQVSGPGSGQQPDYSLYIENGDTIVVSDSNLTHHGSLALAPGANEHVYAAKFVNVLFDSSFTTSSGVAPSCLIQPGTGGGVYETTMEGVWCGLSSADGLLVQAPSGAVDGLQITDLQTDGNAGNGVHIGANVTNWSLTGGISAGNGVNGALISAASSHWSITGGKYTPIGDRTANGQYGINIAPNASDYYVIHGADTNGNGAGTIFDGGSGTHAYVTDNPGYNNSGPLGLPIGSGAGSYLVPPQHYPTTEFITGGTVSSVSMNAVNVCYSSPCTVHRGANQTMNIIYTVAPTIIESRE